MRGVVQLSGAFLQAAGGQFPEQVKGVKIGRQCKRIHFLQATGWNVPEQKEIGRYVVHYSDGQEKVIPIVYGVDVLDWWTPGDAPSQLKNSTVAWTGSNAVTKAQNIALRLYKTTWANPLPAVTVDSLDYVSNMTECAPFLIAITTDP